MALGRKWWGKFTVALLGREKWEAQNHNEIWSDGGAVRQELEQLADRLEAVVAENAKLAVSDFASTATAAIQSGENGEVILGIRIEATEGGPALIVPVPLRKLLVGALTDIRPRLGVDEEAQACLSSVVALGQQLAALGQPRQQQAQAIPAPPPQVKAPPQAGRRVTHQEAATPSVSPRKMSEFKPTQNGSMDPVTRQWTADTFAEIGRVVSE